MVGARPELGQPELEGLDDDALMAEIAGGCRPAFELLCRRHLKRSLGVAQRVLGSPQDAEEVVQDALLQLWEHADRWRGGEAKVSTWLYRVVLNRSLDYRRRRSFAPLEDAGDIPSGQPDAEALVEERQLAACVEEAIAGLPDRQRAALSLCYYGELSCAEAAASLQVSVSAMESLLVRARRMVRARLAGLTGASPTGMAPAGKDPGGAGEGGRS
ncbi:RNA polymerase sigma factor [Azospirillum thermophilum]|uniref:RNA polymerase sigma factor n=1 Tax=Azospirillum thermophilum TaxID=2202148 RepID=A0A2S2CSF3_9PROT|nr:RNA polymerase sigma factor [Azospirillum thermophilum]